jgi:hypothetical protein
MRSWWTAADTRCLRQSCNAVRLHGGLHLPGTSHHRKADAQRRHRRRGVLLLVTRRVMEGTLVMRRVTVDSSCVVVVAVVVVVVVVFVNCPNVCVRVRACVCAQRLHWVLPARHAAILLLRVGVEWLWCIAAVDLARHSSDQVSAAAVVACTHATSKFPLSDLHVLSWACDRTGYFRYSGTSTRGRNSGIFWALLQCSLIIGGSVGLLVVPSGSDISVSTATKLYGVLLAMCISGAVTMLFLGKPETLYV